MTEKAEQDWRTAAEREILARDAREPAVAAAERPLNAS